MDRPSPSPFPTPVEGIVWPPISGTGVPGLADLVRWLQSSQWLPTEELERNAFRQLAITARHCARESPFFADRLKKAGLTPNDLATREGLSALPPMTRRDIQLAGETLFCRNVPESHEPVREGRTSGSTGETLSVKRTEIMNMTAQAYTMRDHIWYDRDFTAPLLSIRARLKAPIERPNWGSPVALLHPTGPGLSLPIATPFVEQAAKVRSFKPGTLLTYPNNLAGLIDELARTGGPPPGLAHMRTFAETLTDELRERVRSYFGVETEDSYSATEGGTIAIQCPDCAGYHVMAETLIVDILDEVGRPCGPGEIGRVVITDFTNFATPTIRYAIGDYAEVGTGTCGRGLPSLRRILGRSRNLMRLARRPQAMALRQVSRFRRSRPSFSSNSCRRTGRSSRPTWSSADR